MSLREKLQDDLKEALRAKDALRVSVIRLVISAIKYKEVEGKAKQGLTEEQVLEVLTSQAKRRKESIEAFRAGNREDLASKEEAELVILNGYLPKSLGEDEVRAIVREAIASTGAKSAREMGAVMKEVMPRTKGRADGKLVNQIVKELLGA